MGGGDRGREEQKRRSCKCMGIGWTSQAGLGEGEGSMTLNWRVLERELEDGGIGEGLSVWSSLLSPLELLQHQAAHSLHTPADTQLHGGGLFTPRGVRGYRLSRETKPPLPRRPRKTPTHTRA